MLGPSDRLTERPGAVVLGSDFKALGVIRSLGRRGVPCAVADTLPRSAWFSRYVQARWRRPRALSDPGLVDFLIEAARKNRMRGWLLIPAQDDALELVARHHRRLSTEYRLVSPPWSALQWAHDKRLLNRVADEVGVAHPKTWCPENEDELRRMPVEFPAVVKPAVSIRLQYATGHKALPVADRHELLEQYRRVAAIDPGAVMVQEVVPGDGHTQFSVAAFCKAGEVLYAMTARRTRQFPPDYGLSSSFVESLEVPELLEPARRLLRRLRLSGMVEVEFKRDRRDGQDKLLDVNVRPWGWHTLCIACGLDFPYLQYQDAIGEPLPALKPVRYGPRWRRLLTDLPAAMMEIRSRTLSPWAYLRSLGGAQTVPSVLDLDDPLPALGDLAVAISRVLKPGHARVVTRPVARYGPIESSRSL